MQKAKQQHQELKIVTSVLSGDKNALWEYYQTYVPILKGFINQKIGDQRDVEEVLQNTLMASLDALRDYTGSSSLKTYLCAIAKHKVADFYRKRRIKSLLFSTIPAIENILQVLTTPEDELDKLITKERVHEILYSLRPKHSQALKLRYLYNLPVAKVAVKLKVSLKSAESTLFRARREFAINYVRQGYAIPQTRTTAGRGLPTSHTATGSINWSI